MEITRKCAPPEMIKSRKIKGGPDWNNYVIKVVKACRGIIPLIHFTQFCNLLGMIFHLSGFIFFGQIIKI